MLSLVILSGGESQRMGRDKGLVSFLGQPLIEHVLQRVGGLADEVIIATNHPQDYIFLGRPMMGDIYPGRGALGGLYTALQAAHQPLVAVIACDMPFASPELLAYEQNILSSSPALDAVVPRTAQGEEPFHAVYRRLPCLRAAETALEQGKWRANAWFSWVSIRFVQPSELPELDPQLAFMNINTPEELARAEMIERGRRKAA